MLAMSIFNSPFSKLANFARSEQVMQRTMPLCLSTVASQVSTL
jgi:hypothetical protein